MTSRNINPMETKSAIPFSQRITNEHLLNRCPFCYIILYLLSDYCLVYFLSFQIRYHAIFANPMARKNIPNFPNISFYSSALASRYWHYLFPLSFNAPDRFHR